MRTVAVVLAGGSGTRFGSASPKQLGKLAGRNLIEHCVHAFEHAEAVDQVLVVAAAAIADQVRADLAGSGKVAAVIEGGTSRSGSTQRALAWLAAREPDDSRVLFHDAARPLVDQRIIADSVAALDRWEAITVAVPSSDTVVEVADGAIRRVLPRPALARCQTPQGFRLSVIREAYQLAEADPGFEPATDDCGVVLRYLPQVPVGLVEGSERNIKITFPADLAVARVLLDIAADSQTEPVTGRDPRASRSPAPRSGSVPSAPA